MHMAMAMANGIYCRQAVSASLAGYFSAIDPMEDAAQTWEATALCSVLQSTEIWPLSFVIYPNKVQRATGR
jgi:hypothetical protein